MQFGEQRTDKHFQKQQNTFCRKNKRANISKKSKTKSLCSLEVFFKSLCSLDYFSNAKFLWPISKYGVKGSAECYECLSGTYHTYSPESFSRMHTAREKKLNMCTEQTSPLLSLSRNVCLPIPQVQHCYYCVKKRSNIKFKNFNF